MIAGSEKLNSGAPFDFGPDAALWANVKAKTEVLVTSGKILRKDADALLADAREAVWA